MRLFTLGFILRFSSSNSGVYFTRTPRYRCLMARLALIQTGSSALTERPGYVKGAGHCPPDIDSFNRADHIRQQQRDVECQTVIDTSIELIIAMCAVALGIQVGAWMSIPVGTTLSIIWTRFTYLVAAMVFIYRFITTLYRLRRSSNNPP